MPDPGKKFSWSRLCHTGYLPRSESANIAIYTRKVNNFSEKFKSSYLRVKPELLREPQEYFCVCRHVHALDGFLLPTFICLSALSTQALNAFLTWKFGRENDVIIL